MLIENLPTPALREAAKRYRSDKSTSWGCTSLNLESAFHWRRTLEGETFWNLCNNEQWELAKELQPHLFKPLPGKPHIKIEGVDAGYFWVGVENMKSSSEAMNAWLDLVSNARFYETPGKAARAWHNYRGKPRNEEKL